MRRGYLARAAAAPQRIIVIDASKPAGGRDAPDARGHVVEKMDILKADEHPWLAPAQTRLRQAAAAQRLPHSLLIQGAAGLGAEIFAHWVSGLALCESPGARPCGACASCLLLRADNHPDSHAVRHRSRGTADQGRPGARADRGAFAKSYRSGYKIGMIEGAETLNANGANAFLKTLEEPTRDTMLIMTVRPAHRLPATIASRCLRIVLRAPRREDARAWLAQQAGERAGWDAALSLAGGAPLLAADIEASGVAELDADMRHTVRQLSAAAVDVTIVAERWAGSNPELRLAWLENWITSRIQASLAGAGSVQSEERVPLSGGLLKPKIRRLFELLDAARQFRRLASTSMNQQLALESLLLEHQDALVG